MNKEAPERARTELAERELSMTTVFRDDLIRIQILRRKCGDDNSQSCVSRALDALESALAGSGKEAP